MPQSAPAGPGRHLAEDWVAARALQVLAGHARQAAHAIGAQARKASLTDDQRSGADAAIRYLTGNAVFLRYDRALAAGWPIATGVIEGACRHLNGDRLDISGEKLRPHGLITNLPGEEPHPKPLPRPGGRSAG